MTFLANHKSRGLLTIALKVVGLSLVLPVNQPQKGHTHKYGCGCKIVAALAVVDTE